MKLPSSSCVNCARLSSVIAACPSSNGYASNMVRPQLRHAYPAISRSLESVKQRIYRLCNTSRAHGCWQSARNPPSVGTVPRDKPAERAATRSKMTRSDMALNSNYINPRSRRLACSSPPMTKWSRTSTPRTSPALTRRRVSCMSAPDGVGSPDGWL